MKLHTEKRIAPFVATQIFDTHILLRERRKGAFLPRLFSPHKNTVIPIIGYSICVAPSYYHTKSVKARIFRLKYAIKIWYNQNIPNI